MKTCVKRVYCPNCKKLVHCHEQKTADGNQVLCAKCGKPVWTREGIAWRYVPESE